MRRLLLCVTLAAIGGLAAEPCLAEGPVIVLDGDSLDVVIEEEPCEEACESAECGECGGEGACDKSCANEAASTSANEFPPTHKQVGLIKVNTGDLPEGALKTFCTTPEGHLVAACGVGDAGDVRLFDTEGELSDSWDLPFAPDAINVGSDGLVYVAGGGKMARFTPEGEQLALADLPHAEAMLANRDAIREEVIESHKGQSAWMTEYLGDLDGQIEDLDKQLEALDAATQSDDDAEESPQDDSPMALFFRSVGRTMAGENPSGYAPNTDRAQVEAMREALVQQKELYEQMIEQQGGQSELTEEQIEQRVESSIAYKLKVASISETGGDVFIATGAEKGYGFTVWRTDHDFANGEKIAKRLSGCCGQMDVQACDAGVFIAENGRHHVRRIDREGEEITKWGSQSRSGVRGFGSCCNPMNVAFGPDGSVYTA